MGQGGHTGVWSLCQPQSSLGSWEGGVLRLKWIPTPRAKGDVREIMWLPVTVIYSAPGVLFSCSVLISSGLAESPCSVWKQALPSRLDLPVGKVCQGSAFPPVCVTLQSLECLLPFLFTLSGPGFKAPNLILEESEGDPHPHPHHVGAGNVHIGGHSLPGDCAPVLAPSRVSVFWVHHKLQFFFFFFLFC